MLSVRAVLVIALVLAQGRPLGVHVLVHFVSLSRSWHRSRALLSTNRVSTKLELAYTRSPCSKPRSFKLDAALATALIKAPRQRHSKPIVVQRPPRLGRVLATTWYPRTLLELVVSRSLSAAPPTPTTLAQTVVQRYILELDTPFVSSSLLVVSRSLSAGSPTPTTLAQTLVQRNHLELDTPFGRSHRHPSSRIHRRIQNACVVLSIAIYRSAAPRFVVSRCTNPFVAPGALPILVL
ncbi:hypothetical protein EXIGLDRAFT_769223 [Exidia glandulosa HHB12029]|uniref:Secreted protein n=1 Tax=Exidia glandulosa HHB12029 TaxID=1314781 RepID=A0A165HLD6_EXIGL|nr:hypothetical protein EXIGLDRAFT_769223 [Exidia glandulosa HHB12029]